MFNLNRGRRVSRMTILRVLLKSLFVRSNGQPRWQGILGVLMLGLSIACGFVFFAQPQQQAADVAVLYTATPAPVAARPVQAYVVTAVASASDHRIIIRLKRSFTNGAYRVLDSREDALSRGTWASMSLADFATGLKSDTFTADEMSLQGIFESSHVQRFVLTAGVDDFTIITDGTEDTAAFVAALKANPLVMDAWRS